MHIGNARIAIVNWLFCRKLGGKFLLRIDDTDSLRSEKAYEDSIVEDLSWLGVGHDEFFRQSEKVGRYKEVMDNLIQDGLLYKCFETPEELEFKRKMSISKGKAPIYDRASLHLSHAEQESLEKSGVGSYWRFKLPSERIVWDDVILGTVSYDLSNISDPVIIKADGTFLYTFSSVVDDLDSGITHIIRGQDHVTNTAVQISMFNAIATRDRDPVSFAHLSLFINKDGSQFSKRLGSTNIGDIRKNGIDPMSVSSLLATLGSSLSIKPFKSMDLLVEYFDIAKFSSNSPKFDFDDLIKLNRKIIQGKSYDEVKMILGDELAIEEEYFPIIQENIATYNDLMEWNQILKKGFQASVTLSQHDKQILKLLCEELENGNSSDDIILKQIETRTGVSGKSLFLPIRLATTGKSHGPHVLQILNILGREEVLRRCRQAS
jgi:glutamyl-tRNA synthetase